MRHLAIIRDAIRADNEEWLANLIRTNNPMTREKMRRACPLMTEEEIDRTISAARRVRLIRKRNGVLFLERTPKSQRIRRHK